MKFRPGRRWLVFAIPLAIIAVVALVVTVVIIGFPKPVVSGADVDRRTAEPAQARQVGGYMPTEWLRERADVIVLGRVRSTSAHWEDRRIVTETVVDVEQGIKGSTGRSLTVTVPGGVVDGIGMKVAGAPTFQPDERAILFLAQSGDRHGVVGLLQGKLSVIPVNGQDHVLWREPAQARPEPRPLDFVVERLRNGQ